MSNKFQNEDFKSESELIAKGATKTSLLNTTKIYSPKTLSVLEAIIRKNNDSAIVAPGVLNDSSQGYEVGSRWIDTASQKTYFCIANDVGAAVWKESGSSGIGGTDILFVENFENSTVADFDQDGLVFESVSPLHGKNSAKLVHRDIVPPTSDPYFSRTVVVDPKFRGQTMEMRLNIKSNASAGNVVLDVYDITNSTIIVTSEQLQLSNITSGVLNTIFFTIPNTCASLSYAITALPQNGSPETFVDDIVLQIKQNNESTIALIEESDSYLRIGAFTPAYASVNTRIHTLISGTVQNNVGSDIQYLDSATEGARFIALNEGTYNFSYSADLGGTGSGVGFSLNSNQLSTNFDIINNINKLTAGYESGSSSINTVSATVFLSKGDTVRLHGTGTITTPNNTFSSLTITKQNSIKQVNVNPNSKITIPTSELRMEGASTRGSTATAIVRFNNVVKIRGDAFEVVSNAVDGTYVRMKKKGKLDISASLISTNASIFISKNQAIQTAVPTVSEIVAAQSDPGSQYSSVSASVFVNTGDIFRISSLISPIDNIANSLNLSFQEQEIQVSVSNTLPQFSESDSSVRVDTANGYGSTATKIRRFSNIRDNIGTDIEYVDSPTDGASFKVKSAGIYNISYSDSFTTSVYFGLSKNSAELTANIASIGVASRLVIGTTDSSSGFPETVSWQGYLNKDDVIRAHSEGSATGVADRAQFTISKVGKPNVTGVDVTPFLDIEINKGMIGEIVPFAGQIDTQYFLECDGRAISRSVYSDLFSKIGINYGQGDGSTIFNLPDYRGQFLRGRIAIANVTGSGTASSNQATFTNHRFNRTGLRVRLASGALTGLAASTNYYVIVVDANTLAFATTRANALANTRIAISGTNTAVIQQWEDVDASTRQASNVGGNTGTNVGSIQEDAIQNITGFHNFPPNTAAISLSAGGAVQIQTGNNTGHAGNPNAGTTFRADFDASRVARASNETRPSNVTVNYGIRYRSNISHIITPTESFSTDTAQLTYRSSSEYTLATLPNANIGDYITWTTASGGNVHTQTTTRPTQTDADMNVNGILLYTRAYNANSTASQPARIAIQIGKGLKGSPLNFMSIYKSVGKLTQGNLTWWANSTETTDAGTRLYSYEPSTGVLLVDFATRSPVVTTAIINYSDFTSQTSGYLVINASKSPALTGVPALLPRIATLSDVKPSGTTGGTATAGAYQTRTLNTIDDPTGIVTSLSGNQFTLPAGEYYIEASAPVYSASSSPIGFHKIKLRNISSSSDSIIGTTMYLTSAAASTGWMQTSTLSGKITISVPTVFELQHRVQTTVATSGFGTPASFGDSEVYSQVKITKVK